MNNAWGQQQDWGQQANNAWGVDQSADQFNTFGVDQSVGQLNNAWGQDQNWGQQANNFGVEQTGNQWGQQADNAWGVQDSWGQMNNGQVDAWGQKNNALGGFGASFGLQNIQDIADSGLEDDLDLGIDLEISGETEVSGETDDTLKNLGFGEFGGFGYDPSGYVEMNQGGGMPASWGGMPSFQSNPWGQASNQAPASPWGGSDSGFGFGADAFGAGDEDSFGGDFGSFGLSGW